jgi:hypothetical protein
MRRLLPALAFVIAALLIWGCSSGKNGDQASNKADNTGSSGTPSMKPTGEANAAGGLKWEIPADWKVGPAQQMRIATYIISAIEGDADNADCAVFHFPGTGGDKDSNLRRWEGQFEQPDGRNSSDLASISETEINGLKVTTIELSGTYKVSAGPMMEVKGKKPGYRLLGAIIDGPQGPVFFKMVGPENTVAASKEQFIQMIRSTKSES